MMFSKKLLMRSIRYPTIFNPPTNYTTTQVATCSGANYTTYSVPEDGWYQVDVRAGGGAAAYNNKRGGVSGGKVTLVYLYQGMTCLLWSGTQGSYSDPGGVCGFPGTKDNTFGGQGATRYYSESGGGGGGAAEDGHAGHGGGGGGAGSGFMAGYTNIATEDMSHTVGSMTLSLNRTLQVGSVVTFASICSYVMCGGGSGSSSDEGSNRSGGGGGGAFGNGGTTYALSISAETGPAGSWGKGEDGSHYSEGVRGAWAVFDFTTGTYDWGLGGGAREADGYCRLSKVIPS